MSAYDRTPCLSVITACRNAEAFISNCLESVINQRQSQIEHIVIDGASIDGTVHILSEYSAKYPHVRWISERDNGQSHALNKGIRMARSNVIGVLNSDDAYEDNAVSLILPHLAETKNHPVFVYGDLRVQWPQDNREWVQRLPKLSKYSPYVGVYPWNSAAYFYSKDLHNLAGYYCEDDHFTMDLQFLIKALPLTKLLYVPHVLGRFIMHPGSKTMCSINAGRLDAGRNQIIRKSFRENNFWNQLQIRRYTSFFRVHRKLHELSGCPNH